MSISNTVLKKAWIAYILKKVITKKLNSNHYVIIIIIVNKFFIYSGRISLKNNSTSKLWAYILKNETTKNNNKLLGNVKCWSKIINHTSSNKK